MKKLLEFLTKNTTGIKDFEIKEDTQNDFIDFTILTKPGTAGLIIGKQGKTIKAIRSILKVRATLDKKGVNVSVEEK